MSHFYIFKLKFNFFIFKQDNEIFKSKQHKDTIIRTSIPIKKHQCEYRGVCGVQMRKKNNYSIVLEEDTLALQSEYFIQLEF